MKEIKGNILIVGLGISNMAVLRFLSSQKSVNIVATDIKSKDLLSNQIEEIKQLFPTAKIVVGTHAGIDLDSIDLAIKNPSVPHHVDLIKELEERNIPIETDISLFYKFVNTDKLVAITGSKGKTTTSLLMTKVLKSQGLKVVECGNMGTPMIDMLPQIDKDTWVVLEQSSYMHYSLNIHKLCPKIMVVTNIFEDHLKFHGTFENYKNDKLSVLKYQPNDGITFVSDQKEAISLVKKYAKNWEVYTNEILPKKLKHNFRGEHYLSNVAAVYTVAKYIKGDAFSETNFLKTVENFETLESRMETRGFYKNIEFLNNTKATSVGAFCADIETLIKEKKNIYIMCGGDDKKLTLTCMAEVLNNDYVKKIALFDATGAHRLHELLNKDKVIGFYKTVDEAFDALIGMCNEENSVIIISPGTASFGIFRNHQGSAAFNLCVEKCIQN